MTLSEYAKQKGFTGKQLKEFGIYDADNSVVIPFFNKDGSVFRLQYCHPEIEKGKRFTWDKQNDKGTIPYGLSRPVNNKVLWIVEGSSDCWTMWANGLDCLGIPGATNFRGLKLEHLQGVDTIAVVQEHDEAGKRFPTQVANHLYDQGFNGKVYAVELSEKDPRELWLKHGPGFKEQLSDEYELRRSLIMPPSGPSLPSGSVSMAEAWDIPMDDVEWLVDGLLPKGGGLALLASRPKVGKSYLARSLALAVSRGSSFLDRHCEPGLVLWLALEERKEQVIRDFKALGANKTDQIRFFFGGAPQDSIKWLSNECKLYKPALVVIDTWHKLTLVENVNDYGAVNRANEPLVKISRELGVTQLWLHHNTKSTAGDGNAVLGSSALFAAVDVLLTMSEDNQGQRTLRSVQRVGEDLENTVLLMNPITGLITAGGTRYSKNLETAKFKILKQMHDDELTKLEIAESVHINRNIASAAINELIREGILVRVDDSNKYKSVRGNKRDLNNEDIYNTSYAKPDPTPSADELFRYANRVITY